MVIMSPTMSNLNQPKKRKEKYFSSLHKRKSKSMSGGPVGEAHVVAERFVSFDITATLSNR
jgi:hypothetical protein